MGAKRIGLVRIGTSGIVLPGNKTTFPAEFQAGTRLHYYGELFNTLEINSSFYKIPKRSTFEKWANEVPDDFKFSVKLWRGITHAKKLAYADNDLINFIRPAEGWGDKKGCLLIQFPASIRIDSLADVEKILHRLDMLNTDSQWQLAIELRHSSWYHESAYDIFAKYKATLVLHDMPHSTPPPDYLLSHSSCSNCVYLRFHGPTGQYTGSYSNQFVDDYAKRINEWREAGKDIYVYFNNTIGSALQNAQRLQGVNQLVD